MNSAAHPILVAGDWEQSAEVVAIHSPYDSSLVGRTYLAEARQVERAIAAASAARNELSHMPSAQRVEILKAISDGIAEQRDEFVRLIALEAGKPVKAARVEVERAIFTFALAAQEAAGLADEHVSVPLPVPAPARKGTIRRFPAGVVAAITPFNFPLNLVAHKLAPALAIGCPVILKPAPQTPVTALKLAKLVTEAGVPGATLSVLPLSNEAAAPLIEDDRLRVLSFTGSAAVGWSLKARAGKKRVLLELGGNAAVIVAADAALERTATQSALGAFSYAGQSCISVQRILVQSSRYEEFLALLLPKVRALRCGDPLDETTDVGPLIRQSDAERVEQWISEAVSHGAKLLCGGKRTGAILEPAVLTDTKPDDKVNSEEVFGPLVTVEPYRDLAEAIAVVNGTRYGLQAGIFANDRNTIDRAFRDIEVGGVIVNDVPTFRSDAMPYGGVKDSGLGREGVRYAMEEMSELKILVES